jgi:hypothetical protein
VEKYDIAECAARAKAAIERMHATVRPGAQTGRGGKAAVLRAVREQLRGALQAEYTVPQLVDALREVFGGSLAAKTVRVAMRDDAAPSPRAAKATKRQRRLNATGVAAAPATSTAPTAAPASSAHADPVSVPVRRPPEVPPTAQGEVGPSPAAVPAAPTGASPPSTSLTSEQRAQYRIPDWADGSDLRAGETLERYATRKRVAGPPHDRSKFIGES